MLSRALALALIIILAIPSMVVSLLLLSTLLRPTAYRHVVGALPTFLLTVPAGFLLPTTSRRGVRTPRLLRWALGPFPLLAMAFRFFPFDVVIGPTVVPVAWSVLSVVLPRADRRTRRWLAALGIVRCLRPRLLLHLRLTLLQTRLVLLTVDFSDCLHPVILEHVKVVEIHHPQLSLSRHGNHSRIQLLAVAVLEPGRMMSIDLHRQHRLVERRSGRCNRLFCFTLDPMHQPVT